MIGLRKEEEGKTQWQAGQIYLECVMNVLLT
jgi:hypothetical protein